MSRTQNVEVRHLFLWIGIETSLLIPTIRHMHRVQKKMQAEVWSPIQIPSQTHPGNLTFSLKTEDISLNAENLKSKSE